MERQKLAQILETTEENISKALSALDVPYKERTKISSSDALRVEELIQFAEAREISYKQAVEEMSTAIPNDVSELLGDISDEVIQELERLLVKAVPDIKGNMQETIRRRQAVLRQLITHMVDRNIINQLKAIDPNKLKAELSEPLTVEVLEGKPTATLPSGEAG